MFKLFNNFGLLSKIKFHVKVHRYRRTVQYLLFAYKPPEADYKRNDAARVRFCLSPPMAEKSKTSRGVLWMVVDFENIPGRLDCL